MSQDFYNSLNAEEQQAFREYKTSSYVLNNELLKDIDVSAKKKYIDYLDLLTSKLKFNEETTLHRATFEDTLIGLADENQFVYKGYLSTCVDIENTKEHYKHAIPEMMPVYMHIICPEGMTYASLDEETFNNENEILLGRNLTLQIISDRVVDNPSEVEQIMGWENTPYYKRVRELKVRVVL